MQSNRLPRDNDRYRWTHHVARKMRYYGLSTSRVLRVVNAPVRVEEGVAPGTLAGMQTAGTKAKPWEVWAMWREEKPTSEVGSKNGEVRNHSSFGIRHSSFAAPRRVIITAWRYPGTSPVRSAVPIPAGVLAELQAEGLLDGSDGAG